jgi:hypothetical protein
MTSRERVLTAVSYREPDWVPYDVGGLEPKGKFFLQCVIFFLTDGFYFFTL